jgi:anaerobic selenocysteine-containing dehydrogenase
MRPRLEALTGLDADPVFDIEHAGYVLSFNAPIVETWLSPVWSQRSYGRFRRGGTQRGRLVHVDSRRSLTARKADEWIAVPDDRQAILAYGIAAVLLRERRIDQAWLDTAGKSFADFDRSVVERLTPDEVADVTGVPVVTILRLARELAAATLPLVAVAADAPAALVDAVLALNGLVGAFDRPGGVFASAPARRPAVDVDDATAVLARVRDGQLKPRLVALRDASALRALGTATDIAEALDRAELVVSFSPYLDEAAAVADLILPVHTPLESWHALTPPSAGSAETAAFAKPAVAARLDTRDLFAVLAAVAEKAAGPLTAIAWKGSEQLVTADLDRLWEIKRGSPYLESFETEWVRELESGGWWVRGNATQEAFTAAVLDGGGWMDPFLAPGRIRQSVDARGGLTFVPPVVTLPMQASSESSTYPLRLVAFTPATVNLVGSANQPVLYEILGQPENAPWHAWIEISPETAEAAGVTAGSRVRVESKDGAIDAVVVIAEHMPADTIAAAFVPATGGGRWAALHTADVRRLWTQPPASGGCAVRLQKT